MYTWMRAFARTAILTAGFVAMGAGMATADISDNGPAEGVVVGEHPSRGHDGVPQVGPGTPTLDEAVKYAASPTDTVRGAVDKVRRAQPVQVNADPLEAAPVLHQRSSGDDTRTLGSGHAQDQLTQVVESTETALRNEGVDTGGFLEKQVERLFDPAGPDAVEITGI